MTGSSCAAASGSSGQDAQSPAKAVIVEVANLAKGFTTPEGRKVSVLADINLTVSEGEIVVLLGQSGCGKSTLLRCVAGLIEPDSGAVRYRDAPISGPNPGTTMVFQSFALLPWMTVRANIDLALEARAVPAAERIARTREAIERVGLKGFESAYPRELSGGMCQRVDFARALVVRPDLLLMDEPFSALDVLTAETLRSDLLDLWVQRDSPTKAILMVTHNMEEAVEMADRIVMLSPHAGRQHDPVTNELPRPRDRSSSQFRALVDFLYATLTGRPEMQAFAEAMARPEEASPAELPLPRVTADGLAGLVAIVAGHGGRADLPDLATRLSLEVDGLLPLAEAAELLGFIQVGDADLAATPTGAQWADADPRTARKIFGDQAARRAPLVRCIVHALSDSPHGRVNEAFFLDLLEHDFSKDTARVQLDTAIDWGRYGQLYRYHAPDREIALATRRPAGSDRQPLEQRSRSAASPRR